MMKPGKKLTSHRKQNFMSSCHDLQCALLIIPSTASKWNHSIFLILAKRISAENSERHNTVNCVCLFLYRNEMKKKSIYNQRNNSGKHMKLFQNAKNSSQLLLHLLAFFKHPYEQHQSDSMSRKLHITSTYCDFGELKKCLCI